VLVEPTAWDMFERCEVYVWSYDGASDVHRSWEEVRGGLGGEDVQGQSPSTSHAFLGHKMLERA
jgi:hypothetical protein